MDARHLRIVDLADLPGFHNPFKCDQRRTLTAEGRERELIRGRARAEAREQPLAQSRWSRRLRREDSAAAARARQERVAAVVRLIRQAHEDERHSLPTSILGVEGLMSESEAIASLARARRSLSDADEPPACGYHVLDGQQIDWKLIAELACTAVEQLGAGTDEDPIEEAMRKVDTRAGRGFLWSLFSDPIRWSIGAPRLSNGQHRVCGLLIGGAERVPVEM